MFSKIDTLIDLYQVSFSYFHYQIVKFVSFSLKNKIGFVEDHNERYF